MQPDGLRGQGTLRVVLMPRVLVAESGQPGAGETGARKHQMRRTSSTAFPLPIVGFRFGPLATERP
jgi:hypothetical protein